MFSNFFPSFSLRNILTICLIPFFVACAKESEPADQPITIAFKTDKTQCLGEISETFGEYFEGKLSAAELKEFWECTRGAVQMFLDVTKGKKNNQAYSPFEIKRFLEEYFLDDFELSIGLIEEVMHLKILLVGGSLKEVSRKELGDLQKVLSEFEEATLVLRPHMKLLSRGLFEPKELRVTVGQVQEAEQGVKRATNKLAQILSARGKTYNLKRFESLILEILRASGSDEDDDKIKNVKKYFPLVTQIKILLVEKQSASLLANKDAVASEQWDRLFDVASELVGYFLRYRVFIEQGDWKSGRGFEQIHHIVISAESLLRRALTERKNSSYEISEFIEFVESLRTIEILPEQFDKPAIEATVKVLVNRLLVIGSEPYEFNRFGLYHLESLRSEYWRWHSSQEYIQSFGFIGFDLTTASSDPAIEEMRKALASPWALVQDKHGRLLFTYPEPENSNLDSRSMLNLERAGIRLLILGYAEDADRKLTLSGLTSDELLQLETDLHPLLEALGLVKEGESIAGRLFIEANLFMPRADGNEFLSFEEGIEYVAYVLSGLGASGVIFDDLEKQCPTIIEDNETKIAIDCFRAKVSAGRQKYLAHLPGVLQYLSTGTPELWTNIEINLEKALRDPDLTKPISRGDVLKMWVLLQYVETFFGKFDTSGNTTVDLNESLVSYDIFQRTLSDLLTGALSDEAGVLAFFTFTMRYGETPFNAKWGGELKFLNWKWSTEKWNYEADRLRVLKILAALNELI